MLNLLTISNLWHHLKRLTRVAIIVSAALALLIGVTIVVLRYWILPDIESYHARIARSLSQAIGSEVVIGKIEADWRGVHPHLVLREVQLLDEQKRPALVLPSIEGSVSWLSLPMAELRLRNLNIPPTDDSDKYHGRRIRATVRAIWNGGDFDQEARGGIGRDVVGVITDKTCFYAEAGGQVGDTGVITLSAGSRSGAGRQAEPSAMTSASPSFCTVMPCAPAARQVSAAASRFGAS